MTSSIVRTNPTAGTATTSSVRDNFGFAADEINRLLRATTDKQVTSGEDTITATFPNVPTVVLTDGIRVLLEIGAANTGTSPTLNLNGTGAKNIKKVDGTSLAIGDLVLGGYYEFVYDSGSTEWKVLNLPISSQDNLLTIILGGLYPVGGLLTTTVATNPGDDDYFFSGITFGTWEAYAAGRTVVGIDAGTTITSASSSSDVVTLVVASHALSAGDSIIVSGFTSDTDANGTFTVDSTTSTNIVYTATNVSDGALTGSSLLVKNAAFDTSQEVGGESNHKLTDDEMASHMHHVFNANIDAESAPTKTNFSNRGLGTANSVNYEIRADSTNPTIGLTSDVVETATGNAVTADQPHNNLQPYIVTYIWKRTA